MAAVAQNSVFSTHDWTFGAGEPPRNEAWADVKMPGGFPATAVGFPVPFPTTVNSRFTYAVGTIEVSVTPGAFSGAAATLGGILGPTGFSLPAPTKRQVVMMQINDAVANLNSTQVYFYGSTTVVVPEDARRATNARGISVWRAPLPADTRIAICGETYDEILPASQAPAGWAAANASSPSGFIAVYNLRAPAGAPSA